MNEEHENDEEAMDEVDVNNDDDNDGGNDDPETEEVI
jgi:hypothetical protein